jgi:hypothetical protein
MIQGGRGVRADHAAGRLRQGEWRSHVHRHRIPGQSRQQRGPARPFSRRQASEGITFRTGRPYGRCGAGGRRGFRRRRNDAEQRRGARLILVGGRFQSGVLTISKRLGTDTIRKEVHVRRKLAPAIEELEAKGFLDPLRNESFIGVVTG